MNPIWQVQRASSYVGGLPGRFIGIVPRSEDPF